MHEYFSELGVRLNRLTQARGLVDEFPAIQPGVAAEVLALAGTVAHTSERKFAPIASFAAGIALGRLMDAGLLSSEQDVVEFISELRTELESGKRDDDPETVKEAFKGREV